MQAIHQKSSINEERLKDDVHVGDILHPLYLSIQFYDSDLYDIRYIYPSNHDGKKFGIELIAKNPYKSGLYFKFMSRDRLKSLSSKNIRVDVENVVRMPWYMYDKYGGLLEKINKAFEKEIEIGTLNKSEYKKIEFVFKYNDNANECNPCSEYLDYFVKMFLEKAKKDILISTSCFEIFYDFEIVAYYENSERFDKIMLIEMIPAFIIRDFCDFVGRFISME
ncbi:MAG: hypothetical protein QXF12_00775 [Candidatus Aenigmatarchaeota archaeon]